MAYTAVLFGDFDYMHNPREMTISLDAGNRQDAENELRDRIVGNGWYSGIGRVTRAALVDDSGYSTEMPVRKWYMKVWSDWQARRGEFEQFAYCP